MDQPALADHRSSGLRRLRSSLRLFAVVLALSSCAGGQSSGSSRESARTTSAVTSALQGSLSSPSFRFAGSLRYLGDKLPSTASALSATGVFQAPGGLSVSQNDGKTTLELVRIGGGVNLRAGSAESYRQGPASLLDPWDVPRFLRELMPSKSVTIAKRGGQYSYTKSVRDRWLTGEPASAAIKVILAIRDNKVVSFETTSDQPLVVRRSFQLSEFGSRETAHPNANVGKWTVSS